MKNRLTEVIALMELARLKIVNLKQQRTIKNDRTEDLLEDAEMALGWALSKLNRATADGETSGIGE